MRGIGANLPHRPQNMRGEGGKYTDTPTSSGALTENVTPNTNHHSHRPHTPPTTGTSLCGGPQYRVLCGDPQ